MSSLLCVLKEKEVDCFTGRILVFGSINLEYLGYILIRDGILIQANFDKLRDLEAILRVIRFEVLDSKSFRYDSSNEAIESFNNRMEFSFAHIKEYAEVDIKSMLELRKFKPSFNLKLKINPSFIMSGDNISSSQFDLLCSILKYEKVSQIYKYSEQEEDSITKNLVSLRRCGALLVCR